MKWVYNVSLWQSVSKGPHIPGRTRGSLNADSMWTYAGLVHAKINIYDRVSVLGITQ